MCLTIEQMTSFTNYIRPMHTWGIQFLFNCFVQTPCLNGIGSANMEIFIELVTVPVATYYNTQSIIINCIEPSKPRLIPTTLKSCLHVHFSQMFELFCRVWIPVQSFCRSCRGTSSASTCCPTWPRTTESTRSIGISVRQVSHRIRCDQSLNQGSIQSRSRHLVTW